MVFRKPDEIALADDALDDADRIVEARGNVLITAAVATMFIAFVLLLEVTGWIQFQTIPVLGILAVELFLNLGLAVSAARWAHSPRMPWVYGSIQVLLLTAIAHYAGGVEAGIFLIMYGFITLHMEVIRCGRAAFFCANFAAASYAALVYLEEIDWIPAQRDVMPGELDLGHQATYVIFAFLALNTLPLFAYRYGPQLRRLALRLQHKVAEQTADLREANRELAEVNRSLQAQAHTLEKHQQELKAFAYIVSHDLKNPVNAILLTVDLAIEHHPEITGEVRASLERILRLAENTEDMIRDLLGLFQVISIREDATWVDTNELVGRALETLRPQIEAKHLKVEVGALPSIWGMPRKLSHVVVNLLSNAVKYVPAERGEIRVSGSLHLHEVRLSFRDNGIGIPAPYQATVFRLFGRVPADDQLVDGQPVSGTGVGLAIVKRIVETHGGSVELESEAGKGSHFCLRFPSQRIVGLAA